MQQIESLGDLHDCVVDQLEINRAGCVSISIADIFANFEGLPEYKGPRRGVLKCDAATKVEISLATLERRIISEVSIAKNGDVYCFTMLFDDSAKVSMICKKITIEI